MREFKFRAWLKNEKRMIFGYDATSSGVFTYGFRYRKSEVITMQYTGKKDKNSKEIYEGDILSNGTGRMCKVVWFEPQVCFDAEPLNSIGDSILFEANNWDFCEVVGNIFDAPQLLN